MRDYYVDVRQAFPELQLYTVTREEYKAGHRDISSGLTPDEEYRRTLGALFALYWLARVGIDGECGLSFGVDDDWAPRKIPEQEDLDGSAALKKRLTEALGKSPKGDGGGGGKSRGEGGGKGISTGTSATLEEAFVRGLVTHGSVETVYGLLKETPLLHDIAPAIFQHASKLHQAKEQADAERKEQEAALQQATREQEQEQAVSRELPTSSTSSTSAALVGSNTRLLKGLRRAGQTALAATSVHAHLNAEFIASGARTLFFSKDASLYFEGLARLVGPPASTSDMAEALAAEHCSARDSHTPFEAVRATPAASSLSSSTSAAQTS